MEIPLLTVFLKFRKKEKNEKKNIVGKTRRLRSRGRRKVVSIALFSRSSARLSLSLSFGLLRTVVLEPKLEETGQNNVVRENGSCSPVQIVLFMQRSNWGPVFRIDIFLDANGSLSLLIFFSCLCLHYTDSSCSIPILFIILWLLLFSASTPPRSSSIIHLIWQVFFSPFHIMLLLQFSVLDFIPIRAFPRQHHVTSYVDSCTM